jgi:hypothetical protein
VSLAAGIRAISLFDGLLILLLGTLVATVAIPRRTVRGILEREDRAVERLLEIEDRLRDHQRSAARDLDRDGTGEYAPLTDVLGPLRDGARRVGDSDVWVLDGYRFAVLVPGTSRRAVPAATADVVPDYAEIAFLLVAWPDEAGVTGMRAYAVTPHGLLQHQIDGYPYGDSPPHPDAPMVVPDGARSRRADRYQGNDWRVPARAGRNR